MPANNKTAEQGSEIKELLAKLPALDIARIAAIVLFIGEQKRFVVNAKNLSALADRLGVTVDRLEAIIDVAVNRRYLDVGYSVGEVALHANEACLIQDDEQDGPTVH